MKNIAFVIVIVVASLQFGCVSHYVAKHAVRKARDARAEAKMAKADARAAEAEATRNAALAARRVPDYAE